MAVSTLGEHFAKVETMKPSLSQDQIDLLYQDYMYELATETGFSAPRMWSSNAPRSFQEYVRVRMDIAPNLQTAQTAYWDAWKAKHEAQLRIDLDLQRGLGMVQDAMAEGGAQ